MQTQEDKTEFDKMRDGTGTWSSLDIFLFSNGQKYSPPRKYNLRASELDWWDATLNYLARAQYGSKHTSIQLYSIDGNRIGGPLELSNGTAYVAVEPPDSFVQSGYEQYLIKASRSWEKRQERKSSDSALTKPDKVNVSSELVIPGENNDSTNIKIIQDIRIVPAATAQDQTFVTVKSDSVSSKAKPNGLTNSIKQTQKKKPSISQQRPSILRKSSNNPVPPLANKGTRATKLDLNKKKIGSSTKRSESVVPLKNESLLTTQIAESKLESTDKKDSGATATLPTVRNDLRGHGNELSTKATTALVTRTMENKSAHVDKHKDLIVEKDILSASFHSEEYLQSICIIANNSDKENLPTSINDTKHSVSDNTSNNGVSNQFAGTDGRLEDGREEARKKYVVADSQTADNIIISISPGDTVKLKLNIEFQNSTISVDAHKYDLKLEQSSVPIPAKLEPERAWKQDMFVVNTSSTRNHDEAPTVVTKSWQTNVTNEHIRMEEGTNDEKLTVCRCNCCSNSDKVLPIRATPVYVDNNNYFILLPSGKNNENLISCNCRLENFKNNSEGDVNELFLPKNTSNTTELKVDKENSLTILRVQSKIISACQCQTQESAMDNKNQASTFEDNALSKFVATKCCMCDDDDSYRNVSESIFRMQSANAPEFVKDSSTQTDWNNILLEARLHKDGHYTFHMPPLDKIKFDNVL